MFIADVVNVKADDKYLNAETGKFELSQANRLYMFMAAILNWDRKSEVRLVCRKEQMQTKKNPKNIS